MRRTAEAGETLIEVLIAVMILGTAVVVLLGGLGTGIRMSDIHRKQAAASTYLRAFAEKVQSAVAASPSAYRDCGDRSGYDPIYTIADTGFEPRVETVRYWDGTSSFVNTCPGTDTGVQRLTLRVRSIDDAAVERVDIIIRKPCRSTMDFPADAPCA